MPYKMSTVKAVNGRVLHYAVIAPSGREVEKHLYKEDARHRVKHFNGLFKKVWGK